jgi:hypothetical protein
VPPTAGACSKRCWVASTFDRKSSISVPTATGMSGSVFISRA